MSEGLSVDVNIKPGLSALQRLQQKSAVTFNLIRKDAVNVEATTAKSTRNMIGLARNAYMTLVGMSRVMGMGISTLFSTMISGVLSFASIMYPILTMESVTPGMQVQAAIGFVNLGLAITAMVLAQSKQQEAARDIQNINFMLHSISNLVGSAYYQ